MKDFESVLLEGLLYREDFYKKVIPDQIIMPGMGLKKTLVLNLENTIINHDHFIGSGIEIKARPFLGRFLDELSPHYEIIAFSNFNDSHVN